VAGRIPTLSSLKALAILFGAESLFWIARPDAASHWPNAAIFLEPCDADFSLYVPRGNRIDDAPLVVCPVLEGSGRHAAPGCVTKLCNP
jgi:hypothetical protein